ncbi:DMT family transporter [Microbacterium phyllosphaerae]|uniref:DMT family transporter n=1 Tax=Microbacterium phyllosphaerae TaxID=124798 RepID=UPI00216A9BAC|nr:DMT family transporter [Microbacterium phyllosphaerae]MCS3441688.1 drug/metabolite transporter (DMT)-like permease [Microbacterium phyllosphaerae]
MSKQIGLLRVMVTVAASVAFVVTWSSGFIIPAFATVDVSPLTLLVWRFVPLAVVLVAVVLLTGAGRGVSGRDLRTQASIGVFAQFGYCVAVYGAVAAGIATGTVALIDAVQPLVVAVLVGPVLGLRVRGAQWVGLGVGAIGVLLVVRSQFGSSAAPPVAYLLPAVAMACLIVGTLLQRRSTVETGVLLTLTVHVTVTAVLLLVIAGVAGVLAPPSSASFWLAVVLTAVFPTLAAYGLYWWLLRRVGITALQARLFLIAPATSLAGGLLLGEPLTVVTVVGFLLCGAGVAVVLVGEAGRGDDDRKSRPEGVHPRSRPEHRTVETW